MWQQWTSKGQDASLLSFTSKLRTKSSALFQCTISSQSSSMTGRSTGDKRSQSGAWTTHEHAPAPGTTNGHCCRLMKSRSNDAVMASLSTINNATLPSLTPSRGRSTYSNPEYVERQCAPGGELALVRDELSDEPCQQ